jgi:hypothetical protein
VEIKWSNLFFNNPGELTSLQYFMEQNSLRRALVTSINETGRKELNGLILDFMPVACYAYTVGRNTINQVLSKHGL